MKQWIYISILLVCACALNACTEDDWTKQSVVGNQMVSVTLNFGATNQDPIEIETRMTYDLHYESMVRNLYVLIFANNERVYGRYFDVDDLNQTDNDEYWSVNNMASGSSTQTTGTVHMKVPTVSSDAEIVLIANIDLDFMNLSEDRLGLVRNKSDLKSIIVSLNQASPERNAGYFMMTGSQGGVTIGKDGTITVPNDKITLYRLDAKIEVNVKVNPSLTSANQRVEAFIPESWEVINLPKSCYLLPNETDPAQGEEEYFHINPKNFETTANELDNEGNITGGVLYGFSFYSLENRESANLKKSVEGNFHHRDRRLKDLESGNYVIDEDDKSKKLWEYAPEYGTYLIIKGELNMVVDPGSTSEQHLTADVTYHIHLGDCVSSLDNYDIKRNTNYKYTIFIKGVNEIETEVETSVNGSFEENQPGASGHLYTAEEDIYTFDAHYGQRVYTLYAKDIDVDNLTWYVRTPFGREGVPQKDVDGNEIYNDLDYHWVEFMLNDIPTEKTVYSEANQWYPQDKKKLMNVIDFVKLLKVETPKALATPSQSSVFDSEGKINVTIFVNEYYYDTNPDNPNDQDVLWKKFVNQPNRLMHILCKSQYSKDGDSSTTGSILTIRQRSIQTPFNLAPSKTDLDEAWGCETEDETGNIGWFYHTDERVTSGSSYKPSVAAGNTSRTDGLHNTACLLSLVTGTGQNKSLNTELRWDTYLDYTGKDIQLKGNYKAGLYSVLLRNRDLDGDGFIDPEELRWYIASLDQLCGLFLGDQGLSSDAQLYPIAASREPNTIINDANNAFHGVYPWRLHVVSSTAWQETAGNVPTIVWAEEGASTGEYQVHWDKPGYSPVRCVRNLGMEAPTATDILVPENHYPKDRLVIVTKPSGTITSSSVYKFDFTNMNEESLRYYTTRELAPSDEYSTMSRLYYGFETGSLEQYTSSGDYDIYADLKNGLERGESPSTTADYRVPNVREGVVMNLYCGGDVNWWYGNVGSMVSSYYSFGYFGNQYDYTGDTHFYSWSIFNDRVTVGNPPSKYIRYVKDWDPRNVE